MSILVLRRVLLPNTSHSFTATRTQSRRIHPTAYALKKKRQAAPPPELFEQDPDTPSSLDPFLEEDELFASKPQSATTSTGASLHGVKSPELLHQRAELFKHLYTSTLDILNQKGRMRQPPRKSTIVRLAALAETKEDLEKGLEVIAAWRSVGLPPDSKTCDDFIGRCARLKYPQVALEALKNRPKYGIDIPSLSSARRLLHALSLPRLQDDNPSQTLVYCLTFAELYPLYNLPPASSDVVSCAILASVIARQVPKDQKIPQKESSEGEVTIDTWGEILTEFEKTVKSCGDVVGHTNPKAVQWLRGSIREIRLTMQRNEGRTRSWLKQFRRAIRKPADENQLSVSTASV